MCHGTPLVYITDKYLIPSFTPAKWKKSVNVIRMAINKLAECMVHKNEITVYTSYVTEGN